MKFLGVIFLFLVACSGSSGGGDSGNSAQSGPPPPPPPPGVVQTVTTDTVRSRSLAVCLNCHNGLQSPNLSTAQALKNNSEIIQFQVNNNRMPPADSGFPLLDACQKEILNTWVQFGKPDASTVEVRSLANCPQGLVEWEPEFDE